MNANIKPDELFPCVECGGAGGEDAGKFGDHGWHPCFACGETGVMTAAEIAQREALVLDVVEPLWYDDASYARYQGDFYCEQ